MIEEMEQLSISKTRNSINKTVSSFLLLILVLKHEEKGDNAAFKTLVQNF